MGSVNFDIEKYINLLNEHMQIKEDNNGKYIVFAGKKVYIKLYDYLLLQHVVSAETILFKVVGFADDKLLTIKFQGIMLFEIVEPGEYLFITNNVIFDEKEFIKHIHENYKKLPTVTSIARDNIMLHGFGGVGDEIY